jgi:hypothetical protein
MIQCPKCHNDTDFAIDAVKYVTAYVTQQKKDDDFYSAGDLEVDDIKEDNGAEWDDESGTRCLRCGHIAPLSAFDADTVTCKFCEGECLALTAHLHRGAWVGDDCCWDERLRITE